MPSSETFSTLTYENLLKSISKRAEIVKKCNVIRGVQSEDCSEFYFLTCFAHFPITSEK
ncbi:hypothetical protein KL86DES1_20909 [uncultured Desulfovibrio sp.]|uniref:Uncharacterized protein n=1 Tax=uncultured Desulfovibrio sp. TaxID=167968 RepID=A0A212L5Q0_9BACT|nr:hypothetical protein KL86DES1_20909 [uncultured Desulfovibrio sp.]VZH33815.1 conserved protein of unknown function [Desulfovibrio sp. 86]